MRCLILIFYIAISSLIFGTGTHDEKSGAISGSAYFITEDEGVHIAADGTRTVEPAKIEEAKHAKDSQPAENDPEGNWGAISNGIQASIRFEKAEFAPNEHIDAKVIIRNVGQNWRMFSTTEGLASCIITKNPKNEVLERKDLQDPKSHAGWLQRHPGGVVATHVDPGMQRKLKLNLQEFYDFSQPGKYTVRVKMKTYPEHSGDFKWVQSGTTTIIITNSAQ